MKPIKDPPKENGEDNSWFNLPSLEDLGAGIVEYIQSLNLSDDQVSEFADTVMSNSGVRAIKEATRPYWAEALYENFRPVPYPSVNAFLHSAGHAVRGTAAPPRIDSRGRPAFEEEAYRMALGLPVENIYFAPSPYKPSISEDPDAQYFRVHPQVIDRESFVSDYGDKPVGFKTVTNSVPFRRGFTDRADWKSDPLANYTVSVGEDDKGKYVSIYDRYDLSGAASHLIKPFEIYDRIYIDSPREVQ